MEERIIKDINNLLTQLFQKMRESGYEWDAEKKELKKIEQKPYGQMEKCINCQFNYAGYCNGTCILKNNVQKPAWSEDDDINLGKAIWYVENPAPMVAKDSMLIEWLKNLRGRVQPQHKQKPAWSEEDENHVKSILSTIECCKAQFTNAQAVVEAYNADIAWLKSLRAQKRSDVERSGKNWKPTEEHLSALKEAFNKGSITFHDMEVLAELYQNLIAL